VLFNDLKAITDSQVSRKQLYLEIGKTLVGLKSDILLILETLNNALEKAGEDRGFIEEIGKVLEFAAKRVTIPEKDEPAYEALISKVRKALGEE
jgi:hypothetical protein